MSILKRTAIAAAVGLLPYAALADEMKMIWTPPSGMAGEIDNSHAQILTTPEGAAMRVESSGLTPGHVVSVWFVVIQSPENCASRPCPPQDPMGRSDEVSSVAAHGGSAIVDAEGRISVAGFMPLGEVANSFFETTLTTPETAEIHLAVHDHGPLIAEMASDMMSTYRGGCTDESIPPYYPASAVSFGAPGPNECGTVQVALFMQDT